MLTLVAGAVTAITLGIAVWADQSSKEMTFRATGERADAAIAARMQAEAIKDIRRQLDELKTGGPSPAGATPELKALEGRLARVEAAQAQLSSVILTTPEKAVAIPMMRRDIDELKVADLRNADALKYEIDRIYDFGKWIIGGFGAGILSLATSQFIRRREGVAQKTARK